MRLFAARGGVFARGAKEPTRRERVFQEGFKDRMLIIKRKAQDIITIAPKDGIDTSLPIEDLFEGGVIEITLLEVGRRQVKVAIDAPEKLQIWRGRKEPRDDDAPPPGDAACG